MSKPDRRAKRPKKKEDDALKAQRPEQEASATRPEHPVLGLQGTVGNRAVQRLVEGSQPAGESVLIQRHLGPAAEGLGTAASTTLSTALGNVASAMGLMDAMRSVGSMEPCPTAEELPPIPATGGV